MGLGMTGLMADLGLEMKAQVNTDSSAAKSIASRRGARGELEIKKVKGEENVADGLTKHVEPAQMDYYMKKCGLGVSV